MVLLIDTNVVLDFMLKRKEFYEEAHKIMELCAKEEVKGYVALHSISNIWYILRGVDDTTKREHLKRICQILEVCAIPHKDVESALDKTDFKDFEDCLQDFCAVAVNADYIITRNTADFAYAETKAITPQIFLEEYKSEDC